MAAAIQQHQSARLADFIQCVFHAIWADGQDLSDPATTAQLLHSSGFDATELQQQCQAPEIKAAVIQATEEAEKRGAFGAPTFFVGDEMFFGQDRLDFVRRALQAG